MSSNLIFLPTQKVRSPNPLGDTIKAYLNFEGPNGSTQFTDHGGTSVISAAGVSLTTDAPLSGASSAKFNGAQGQAFYVETGVAPGDRSFTLEAYVSFDRQDVGQGVFDMRPGGFHGNNLGLGFGGGLFNIHHKGAALFNNPAPIVTGQRHHIAVTVQGVTIRLFVDGKLIGQGTSTGGHQNSRIMLGGNAFSPSVNQLFGKMDEFRYTVGEARYVQEFVPPTGPLHNIE